MTANMFIGLRVFFCRTSQHREGHHVSQHVEIQRIPSPTPTKGRCYQKQFACSCLRKLLKFDLQKRDHISPPNHLRTRGFHNRTQHHTKIGPRRNIAHTDRTRLSHSAACRCLRAASGCPRAFGTRGLGNREYPTFTACQGRTST